MVLHWETQNLCLVLRSWQITGPVSLIASLLGVFALSAGFELLRSFTRRYEASRSASTLPSTYIPSTFPLSAPSFITYPPTTHYKLPTTLTVTPISIPNLHHHIEPRIQERHLSTIFSYDY